MNTGSRSCAFDELLLDYAYGELERGAALRFEAHLSGCARCRDALEAIAGTRRAFAALTPEPAPQAGLESLLAYARQRTERPKAPSRLRWLVPAFSAGGLAMVLVAVLARQGDSPAPVMPPPSRASDMMAPAPPTEKMATQSGTGTAEKLEANSASPTLALEQEPAVARATGPLHRAERVSKEEAAPARRGGEFGKGLESRESKKAETLMDRERAAGSDQAATGRATLMAPAGQVTARGASAPRSLSPMAAEESFGAAMVARPQSKADGVGQEEAKGEASEEIISGYHMGSAAQPEDAGALFLKAQKQARTGDAEGAVASYARFLARHPEDRRAPEAAWARAGLLEKLGRASEAESARAELLSRYPRSTQAELARRRIAPGSAGAPRAAPAAPQKSPASPAEDLGEAAQ